MGLVLSTWWPKRMFVLPLSPIFVVIAVSIASHLFFHVTGKTLRVVFTLPGIHYMQYVVYSYVSLNRFMFEKIYYSRTIYFKLYVLSPK